MTTIKFLKSLGLDNALKQEILKILPSGENGLITRVRKDSDQFFSFTLRLNRNTKEEALSWIKEFEQSSLTTYRVSQTFAENTPRIIFRKNFRCIQNSYPKKNTQKPHEKHTKCRATVTTVIKNRVKRTRDLFLDIYPCEVNVNWFHNHTINYEALKYRRSDELSSIFAGYYAKGHSPASALELHKMKLQTEYGDDFYKVAADGSRCPNKVWCYHMYYKIFQKTCKDPYAEEMLASLGDYIEAYNEKCQDTCAMMSKDMTSHDVVVSICSPLSKRVLTLKSVKEIMFVTSSGNRVNCSANSASSKRQKNNIVLFLLSPSIAGALPLGIIVSSSDREIVINQGIDMLKEMLGDKGFSPQIIISDDCEMERISLTKMFPVSAILLCKSHVLQTIWRFLSDSKNNVAQDKLTIFKQFSTLLHSKTKELFDENFIKLMNLESVANNYNLSSYFNNYKRREMEWALYARVDVMKRNKYTYHNSEASIRVLKEQMLHRTKSFNVLQLVDAMTSAMSCYYEKRLLNCINDKAQAWESKYYMPPEKIVGFECKQANETEYIVTHPKGEECLVNPKIGACTCPLSADGTLCKHQYAVLCKFNILHAEEFVPTKDVIAKKHLYYIATGKQMIEDGVRWCDGSLLDPIVIKKEPVDIQETPTVENESNVLETKIKKEPKTEGKKGRRRKRKRKDSTSEDEIGDLEACVLEMPKDNVNENIDEDMGDGYLLEEYSNMVQKINLQQGNSHRDADIEKELILEELKDMVKVVPAESDKETNTGENKESEKELLLEELRDMFKCTGEKLINKYEVFKPAIQAMVSAFKNLKSETALLSAYHSFGRNPKTSIKASQIEHETESNVQHVQYVQLQPSEEGHYAYLDEEGVYNMVVGPNSELHIQENVTIGEEM